MIIGIIYDDYMSILYHCMTKIRRRQSHLGPLDADVHLRRAIIKQNHSYNSSKIYANI